MGRGQEGRGCTGGLTGSTKAGGALGASQAPLRQRVHWGPHRLHQGRGCNGGLTVSTKAEGCTGGLIGSTCSCSVSLSFPEP